MYIHVAINNAWVLNEGLKLVIANYSYVNIIQLVFIGFINEITHEMIHIDKCYYMKTINRTAEGYFHSCRFPCTGQCVLELQASSVTKDIGTARHGTEDFS